MICHHCKKEATHLHSVRIFLNIGPYGCVPLHFHLSCFEDISGTEYTEAMIAGHDGPALAEARRQSVTQRTMRSTYQPALDNFEKGLEKDEV